jgi:hypothetical protein
MVPGTCSGIRSHRISLLRRMKASPPGKFVQFNCANLQLSAARGQGGNFNAKPFYHARGPAMRCMQDKILRQLRRR